MSGVTGVVAAARRFADKLLKMTRKNNGKQHTTLLETVPFNRRIDRSSCASTTNEREEDSEIVVDPIDVLASNLKPSVDPRFALQARRLPPLAPDGPDAAAAPAASLS
jgi:hypothetical protein